DHLANETVNYTYDGLNRWTVAETAGGGGWGQSFGYDGFGNLTTKAATKGTVPVLSVTFDPATNHQLGGPWTYDANGNTTSPYSYGPFYDVENRMVQQGQYDFYVYDPAGKRVKHASNSGVKEFYFYGIGGQKLETLRCTD